MRRVDFDSGPDRKYKLEQNEQKTKASGIANDPGSLRFLFGC